MNYYIQKDHQNLSKHVHKLNSRWMVSYDNHELILNLYADRNRLIYKLAQSASNRVGNEALIFSNDLTFENSIKFLKQPILI